MLVPVTNLHVATIKLHVNMLQVVLLNRKCMNKPALS